MTKAFAELMQEARAAIVAEQARTFTGSYGNGGPVWGMTAAERLWGVGGNDSKRYDLPVGAGGGGGGNGSWACCGQPATRSSATPTGILDSYCPACGPQSDFEIKAHPAPAPDPTHCPCGAELMGKRAKRLAECGDCVSASLRYKVPGDLDTRIKAAAKPDPDPTSGWNAWANPGWES